MNTRKMLVFLIAFVFILSPGVVLSATRIEKFDLPDGYKGWTPRYSAVCYENEHGNQVTISINAKVDSVAKAVEYISAVTTVDNPLDKTLDKTWYIHGKGDSDSNIFVYVYEPRVSSGWIKLNALAEVDVAQVDRTLKSINSFMATVCPQVDMAINNFFEDIFNTLSNKTVPK